MNKLYFSISAILISFSAFAQTTYTSVANGDWFTPSTWSPAAVPDLNDPNIIINTAVTFNQTLLIGGGAGYCRINPGGSLTNISGQDSILFGNDYILNYGYISCGVWGGENNDSTVNYGSMNITTDFIQSGLTINHSSGNICIGQQLVIGQDLENDGSIQTFNFINGGQVSGSGGQFCISNNYVNTGIIAGTVDFCDATPNTIQDINVGTIAGSVTNCSAGPCGSCSPNGITDLSKEHFTISIAPNPSDGNVQISIGHALHSGNVQLYLYDFSGKLVRTETFSGNVYQLNNAKLSSGIYFLRLEADGFVPASSKLIVQ